MAGSLTLGLPIGWGDTGSTAGQPPSIISFSIDAVTATSLEATVSYSDTGSTPSDAYYFVQLASDPPITDPEVVKAGTGALATATETGMTGDLVNEPAPLSATLSAGTYRVLLVIEGEFGLSSVASATATVSAPAGLTAAVTDSDALLATLSGGSGGGTTGVTLTTTVGERHVVFVGGSLAGNVTAATLDGNAGVISEVALDATTNTKVTAIVFNTVAANAASDLVLTVNNVFLFPNRVVDCLSLSGGAVFGSSAVYNWATGSPVDINLNVTSGNVAIAGLFANSPGGMTTISSPGMTQVGTVLSSSGRLYGRLFENISATATPRTFSITHNNTSSQVGGFVFTLEAS